MTTCPAVPPYPNFNLKLKMIASLLPSCAKMRRVNKLQLTVKLTGATDLETSKILSKLGSRMIAIADLRALPRLAGSGERRTSLPHLLHARGSSLRMSQIQTSSSHHGLWRRGSRAHTPPRACTSPRPRPFHLKIYHHQYRNHRHDRSWSNRLSQNRSQ